MAQVTGEQLKECKIFLGTPMYGGNCSGIYAKSVADLTQVCSVNGISLRHYFLFNESLVQRARNYVVDEFMRSDCTHLMFIDADIGFDPMYVLNMLAINIGNPSTVNVITGPYPKKTIAWEKVSIAAKMGKGNDNPFNLEKYSADFAFNMPNMRPEELEKPVEVAEAATGFMLIPRDTFDKFRVAYPELDYKPDHIRTENFDGERNITAFFDCIIDPVTRRYLSEDYFFCQKVREVGMGIWMCPWMKLNHIGMHVYRGDLSAMMDLGLKTTGDNSSKQKSYERKPSKFKQQKRKSKK